MKRMNERKKEGKKEIGGEHPISYKAIQFKMRIQSDRKIYKKNHCLMMTHELK